MDTLEMPAIFIHKLIAYQLILKAEENMNLAKVKFLMDLDKKKLEIN